MTDVGGDPEQMYDGAERLRRSAEALRGMRSELHDGGTLAAAIRHVPLAAALDRLLAVMVAEVDDLAVQLDALNLLAREAGIDLWQATGG